MPPTDPDLIRDAAFFAVGSCRGPERMARRRGSWHVVRFPVLAVLLRHATCGVVLFDTGYAPRYFDVLRRWPYWPLGSLLGARLSAPEALPAQMLARCDVRPGDVQTLIVSHFHLDHIAGLRDFPAAGIVCSQAALASIDGLRVGLRAAHQVFHPGLLPETSPPVCVRCGMTTPTLRRVCHKPGTSSATAACARSPCPAMGRARSVYGFAAGARSIF